MDLSTLFEIIGKYGWWSLLIAAGMGLIYIIAKLVANRISDGVRGGMDDIANKLTGTVTSQLQEMSSTNSSQLEMLSQNIAKQNNELVKAMGIQNEKLLSYIINNGKATEELHDRRVEKRMDVAESIIDKLKEIMHITHGKRAFIIEFHNSYKNLSGSPFAKYTCTYEWFDKGLEQIGSKIVGLPFSSMARIVGDVKRTGKHQILYTDIDKMESENPQLFSLLKDDRTTAVFYNTLYDEDNKMMGMVVVEWQGRFSKEVFDATKMNEVLANEALQLAMWINLNGPSVNFEELNEV